MAHVLLQGRLANRTRLPNGPRIAFWLKRLGEFGSWQIVSQTIQLLTGFLLIRWMTLEQYAQYGLALGIQNMLAQLVDLGFSGAILALVGPRIQDRKVLGTYVQSAASLRNMMLAILGPIAGVGFIWFAHAHNWALGSSAVLLLSIITFVYFQGWVTCYSAPLLMQQKLNAYYSPVVYVNVGRLAVCSIAQIYSLLGAALASALNAVSVALVAFKYRVRIKHEIDWSSSSNAESRNEIRRYVAPLLPGMIFYAFQGQIQVLLISAFGRTQSIAEVTALGRLGQLFTFLSSFVSIILVPYIARVDQTRLAKRYLQGMALVVGMSAAISGVAFLYPFGFLWVLGAKYSNLPFEMQLSMCAASFSFISVALYAFNNARKWVYHWTGVFSTGGLILLQGSMAAVLDLSTTRSVLVFSLIAAIYPILPFGATAIFGYRQDLRNAPAT